MRCAILLALTLALAGSAVAGDVIVLKDGQEMSGTITSQTEKGIEIKVADGEFFIPSASIAQIRRGDAPAGDDDPAPAGEEKPGVEGKDVIRLRADGREIMGTILAEDDATITMKVGDRTLGFDKSFVEWVKKDGKIRRFDGQPAEEPRRPERPRPERARPERDEPAPEASPALKKWIRVCVKHMGSDDPAVRRSAGAALRAAGPAARPILEAMAAGDNEATAAIAKRLLEAGRRENAAAGRGGERGGRRVSLLDRLTEQLKLTDDQKTKVTAVLEENMKVRGALMESVRSGDIPREEMRERWQALQAEMNKKMAEILTEEQVTKYREMMERGRGRGGRRGPGGSGGGGRGGEGGGDR
jgi:periplasmic protein CpxP/Spy